MSPIRNLCVVMERRTLANRWVDHQWEAISVLPERKETEPLCLLSDAASEQWVYPALPLQLHTDEVENYLLNVSAPEPRLFVITREQDGRAVPFSLTVSYGEAARMLDAGETVDGIPLPPELWTWVTEYSKENFRPPEPKKEKRYARSPQQGGRA
jgi:hypothetical protein